MKRVMRVVMAWIKLARTLHRFKSFNAQLHLLSAEALRQGDGVVHSLPSDKAFILDIVSNMQNSIDVDKVSRTRTRKRASTRRTEAHDTNTHTSTHVRTHVVPVAVRLSFARCSLQREDLRL